MCDDVIFTSDVELCDNPKKSLMTNPASQDN